MFFLLLLMLSLLRPCLGNKESDKNKTTCYCVPLYLCPDEDSAIIGQGIFDVRLQNSKCASPIEICCTDPMIETIPNPNPKKSEYSGCGYQNQPEILTRITMFSEETRFGELPWTVIVLIRNITNQQRSLYYYKCGGSLIHPKVVLTVAHCIHKLEANILTIRAGQFNTISQTEAFPHQDQSVKETVIHPNFQLASLKYDIGLIFLINSFVLTPNINTICLPPPEFNLHKSRCTATGWGTDKMKNGKYSRILKKIDVPLVSRERCETALRNTKLGPYFLLHKSFICAGGESAKDTCRGDGGSPLVCPIPGRTHRFVQMGIVSWGIGCGNEGVPGVYVNVPFFTTWIDEELNSRNLELSYYRY